jgi:SAM-dependent methyltransferase
VEENLRQETEKLARSWERHEAAMLRDYLVSSVEDPRLNLQSVLSRHFVTRALAGDRFGRLMEQEYRFAAVMNWLAGACFLEAEPETSAALLHALQQGADNAEGVEIPLFVRRSFALLPAQADGLVVPNYLETVLTVSEPMLALDTFADLWRAELKQEPVSAPALSVLEPACGSANDYRFLNSYGISRLVDYSGFDLCAKNVENARNMFPGVRFDPGNVFEIAAGDNSFDLCFVHDLFEHLSIDGLDRAVREICRVTRNGICAGFFNLDEIPEHRVHPVEDYHWNTLSLSRMRELFAICGFAGQVIHIGTFLREHTGCEQTHNANAYTMLLRRA